LLSSSFYLPTTLPATFFGTRKGKIFIIYFFTFFSKAFPKIAIKLYILYITMRRGIFMVTKLRDRAVLFIIYFLYFLQFILILISSYFCYSAIEVTHFFDSYNICIFNYTCDAKNNNLHSLSFICTY
jgi:hypothetical protein